MSLTYAFTERPIVSSGDWASRSTAPGVVMATRFDTQAEVDNWKAGSNQDHVSWQQSGQASGNGCARFAILKTDGESSGNICLWLKNDQTGFSEGDTFYVSFRQYVPHYLATHVFQDGGGWKQCIVSRRAASMNGVSQDEPYGSNQVNEIVLQNTQQRGYVQGYNQDGVQSPGWEDDFPTACSAFDIVYQNAVDRGPQNVGTACENARARYGGLFSYTQGGYADGRPDPKTGAFIYYPDEWVTYKLRVDIGTWGNTNSRVRLYCARFLHDFELIINQSIRLGNGPDIDALWLTPFHTGRTADATRENTYTLYDEIIVSTQDIVAPGVVSNSIDEMSAGSIISIADTINAHRPEPGSGAPEGTVSSAIWSSLQGGSANWPGIITAWNGGAGDESTGKQYLWGGGHSSYGGYEVYEIDPLAETPGITRLNNPIQNPGTGSESIGSGSTLGPNTRHTYAGLQAWKGRYLYIEGGGLFPGISTTNPGWVFDLVERDWTQVTSVSGYNLPTSANMTVYHPWLDELWTWRNSSTGTWVRLSGSDLSVISAPGGGPASNWFGDGCAALSPFFRNIVYIGTGAAGSGSVFYVWNISNPASVATYTTPSTSGATTIIGANQPGITWCQKIRKYVAWDGSGSTVARNKLVTINPNGWVFTEHTLTGTTPSAAPGDYQGTYNRFRYVPQKDVFIGYNSVSNNIYVFKLPSDA